MKSARILLIAVALAARAAYPAEGVDPERLAEAKALIGALHVDEQMEAIMGTMASEMARRLPPAARGADPRAAKIAMEEGMRIARDSAMSQGGLFDMMAEAYATRFTLEELRQVHAFYQTAAAQHMLRESGAIAKEILPRWFEKAKPDPVVLCARIKARFEAEGLGEAASKMTCATAPV